MLGRLIAITLLASLISMSHLATSSSPAEAQTLKRGTCAQVEWVKLPNQVLNPSGPQFCESWVSGGDKYVYGAVTYEAAGTSSFRTLRVDWAGNINGMGGLPNPPDFPIGHPAECFPRSRHLATRVGGTTILGTQGWSGSYWRTIRTQPSSRLVVSRGTTFVTQIDYGPLPSGSPCPGIPYGPFWADGPARPLT